MNQANKDYLIKTYPSFFRKYYTLPTCGDGWFELISKLCSDLAALNLPSEFEIRQVKEKFGGLRVYTSVGSIEVSDLIRAAENQSYQVCEECGKPGTLRRDRNWWLTLCDECDGRKHTPSSG